MREAFEDLEALVDDCSRSFALDVGDKADATSVMLEAGIVQALRDREFVFHGRCPAGQKSEVRGQRSAINKGFFF